MSSARTASASRRRLGPKRDERHSTPSASTSTSTSTSASASFDVRAAARELYDRGVVVVPLEPYASRPELLCAEVARAREEFIEFKVKGKLVQQVLGGFGALGNPSSFHHPTIRALRARVKRQVAMPLFGEYARIEAHDSGSDDVAQARVEALFDRLCVRAKAFGALGAETWHRDTFSPTKYVDARDECLPSPNTRDTLSGGWLNCNAHGEADRMQYFVCVPGSHKGKKTMTTGAGFEMLDKSDATQYGTRGERIAVPPGHVVIFLQAIVHKVANTPPPPLEPSLRLFVAHHLAYSDTPLYPWELTRTWIADQAVPRLPSGQWPAMYSANHYSRLFKGGPLVSWGEATFRPEFLESRTSSKPSGGADGTDLVIHYQVPSNDRRWRKMQSLREYGVGMMPEYSEDDVDVMRLEDVHL